MDVILKKRNVHLDETWLGKDNIHPTELEVLGKHHGYNLDSLQITIPNTRRRSPGYGMPVQTKTDQNPFHWNIPIE